MIASLPLVSHRSALIAAAQAAASRVAPLWPLARFVAVNPFVGLADKPFAEAAALLARNAGTSLAMPPTFYWARYADGLITRADLRQARDEAGKGAPEIGELISAAKGVGAWRVASGEFTTTFSETFDSQRGTRWAEFFREETSKWCAAYFDEGQSLWKMPWRDLLLFPAWRQAAVRDCNPEVAGVPGWRRFLAQVTDDPLVEIARASERLGIGPATATDIFHRLLLGLGGWAGHLAFRAHEKGLRGESDELLLHLLAIQLVTESAMQGCVGDAPTKQAWSEALDLMAAPTQTESEALLPARIWQRAHECARQRELFDRLAANAGVTSAARPEVQAVFCIDVRSEVYRRALEGVAPGIQTIGFAGFFGFPIEVVPAGEPRGTAQCPVLLAPKVTVPPKADAAAVRRLQSRKRDRASWGGFKSSAVSSFVFVETAGLGFAARFARDLSHRPGPPACSCAEVEIGGIPLVTQTALAAGALRHLGLASGGLARLVLLCGHGSETVNNPYGSSLDCGACGGHSGEANARTAVAILNRPAVRTALATEGIEIPTDTWFLAGLHNTTTDEVTLFGGDGLPATHRDLVGEFAKSLEAASRVARLERAPRLGLSPAGGDASERVESRSRDWSQVRPEWGLAGNYAFVAAPRGRTRGLDLGGRVFLHDYNFAKDVDEATLELLLTAPVVVASWINLQYYASTVDNRLFGSGNKALHNVAGNLGVFEGNGGDIRVGLPLQSLHDGRDWRHEPLRLSVCVEAPPAAIDRVLVKHRGVADLVANQWIHLFALDTAGCVVGKSDGRCGWTLA